MLKRAERGRVVFVAHLIARHTFQKVVLETHVRPISAMPSSTSLSVQAQVRVKEGIGAQTVTKSTSRFLGRGWLGHTLATKRISSPTMARLAGVTQVPLLCGSADLGILFSFDAKAQAEHAILN